jgi:hypothetical protein
MLDPFQSHTLFVCGDITTEGRCLLNRSSHLSPFGDGHASRKLELEVEGARQ